MVKRNSTRILLVHNFYQQAGGEDQVFASETGMLEEAGHQVFQVTDSNDRVSALGKIALAKTTIWNAHAYRRVHSLVRDVRAEVAHFHNTFPLLSPACYYAAQKGGAAVVQTLHNYRLLCPAATLFRAGNPCEDCIGKNIPWPGVIHSCYRHSRVASAGVAAMLAAHRAMRTWTTAVDRYVALTHFSKIKFVEGGLPEDRITVKPNFMEPDPGKGRGGDPVVFAGRLSEEKGLEVLVETWRTHPDLPQLKIIGDGPLASWLKQAISSLPKVDWLGKLPREAVLEHFRGARAVLVPSTWYENFPVVVVEAYATATPVIVSNAGTLPELVRDGLTGFIFRSRDCNDLAAKVKRLGDATVMKQMRAGSRFEYERFYSRDRNLQALMDIYESAVAERNRK